MHIPHGWTTEAAGGYGNFSRLTHDRCGAHINVDLVLDQQGARRFLANHECEDLREQRQDREEQEASDRAANDVRDHEIAALRTRVDGLAERLDQIAAPAPVRLLVLNATTADTLNASVDALATEDFLAVAAAVDTAQYRSHERTALTDIRDVLDAEAGRRTAIGVVFAAEEYHSGYYFGASGTVLFYDGGTLDLEFEAAEETLRELYEQVDYGATLAVDLRTDSFNLASHTSPAATIHARFGIAEPEDSDDRILGIVRDTLAGDYEHDGDGDLAGRAVGVQFKSRPEEDGHYLSSDDGFVLFDSGDVAIVTFPDIAKVFAEAVGCVGSMYSVIVDLRGEATVTHVENDLVPMTTRFDLPD